MEGLSLAIVTWQAMHLVVAGNVMRSPGSGLMWHCWHFSPKAKCFLWLYGMGCAGGSDFVAEASVLGAVAAGTAGSCVENPCNTIANGRETRTTKIAARHFMLEIG